MKVVKIEKRSFDTTKSKWLATRLAVLERNFSKDTILRVLKSLGVDKEDSDISFKKFYADKNAVSLIFSLDGKDHCITFISKDYVILSLAKSLRFSTMCSTSNFLRIYDASGYGANHYTVKITDYLEIIVK